VNSFGSPSNQGSGELISTPYRERLWTSWWITLLFLALITLLSSLLIARHLWGTLPGDGPELTGILIALDVFFVLVYANFSRLQIEIDPNMVEVRYGLIRKRIPVTEIASAETARGNLGVYLGVGIRYGTDGSVAFTTSLGDAVRVNRKTGRAFVFSTNRPIDVSDLINTLVKTVEAPREKRR